MNDRLHESIGARIKRLRTEIGLTQPQLASKARVHWRTLQKNELDMSLPNISSAVAYAKAFKVSLDYLCCVTDER